MGQTFSMRMCSISITLILAAIAGMASGKDRVEEVERFLDQGLDMDAVKDLADIADISVGKEQTADIDMVESLEGLADVSVAKGGSSRNPKFFYVSSTTSTISTFSICYTTQATLTKCAKKRKRNILTQADFDSGFSADSITHSGAIDSSVDDTPEVSSEREAKFLLYWLTTTTTTTAFTATSKVGTLECTPDGWTLAFCG